LIEALLLGLAGGAAGVGFGVIGTHLFADNLGWPMVISTKTVLVAVGFSSAVGIIFGYYPASQAAALDPIEALRSE
jgi:putative ABC transport system permease protein